MTTSLFDQKGDWNDENVKVYHTGKVSATCGLTPIEKILEHNI